MPSVISGCPQLLKLSIIFSSSRLSTVVTWLLHFKLLTGYIFQGLAKWVAQAREVTDNSYRRKKGRKYSPSYENDYEFGMFCFH